MTKLHAREDAHVCLLFLIVENKEPIKRCLPVQANDYVQGFGMLSSEWNVKVLLEGLRLKHVW